MSQETEVTETEVEAPSLRDELSKQFDAAPSAPSPDSGSSAAPVSSQAARASADVPAASAEKGTPAVAAAPPAGQKPGEDLGQDAKDLATLQAAADANRPIPERLKAKWGDKWEKLDPSVRSQFHDYESDIGRVTSKYGKDAKAWNDTVRVLAPYEQMIRAEGGTLHGAMANLFETARILRQGSPEQKAQLARQMIQHFGISLEGAPAATAAASAQQPSGVSSELIDRLNLLERNVLTRNAEETHNLRERVNSEVETFLGDSANIYLQEPGYLDTMQALIRAGKAEDLKSAYDQAAWLHDRPREMEIAKRNLPRTNAAAEAAARARSAAVSVNGASPGTPRVDLSKFSLRDELAAHLDGHLDS